MREGYCEKSIKELHHVSMEIVLMLAGGTSSVDNFASSKT